MHEKEFSLKLLKGKLKKKKIEKCKYFEKKSAFKVVKCQFHFCRKPQDLTYKVVFLV